MLGTRVDACETKEHKDDDDDNSESFHKYALLRPAGRLSYNIKSVRLCLLPRMHSLLAKTEVVPKLVPERLADGEAYPFVHLGCATLVNKHLCLLKQGEAVERNRIGDDTAISLTPIRRRDASVEAKQGLFGAQPLLLAD